MLYVFEVKRTRSSVTQGTADVYLNGTCITEFTDKIVLLDKDENFYGENIKGWASVTPDSSFIEHTLYHPFDNMLKISDKVKKVLKEC